VSENYVSPNGDLGARSIMEAITCILGISSTPQVAHIFYVILTFWLLNLRVHPMEICFITFSLREAIISYHYKHYKHIRNFSPFKYSIN
jgi:hypothetical protein